MNLEELAHGLGIQLKGEMVGNKYIVNLKDSDEYSLVYNILDKSDLLDLDVSSIELNDSTNKISYQYNDYTVTLEADFDSDIYKVIIM